MMKKRIQILFGSIALLGMSACSEPYVQPDAPILLCQVLPEAVRDEAGGDDE